MASNEALADSWFKLAEVLGVLAGLTMISAGFIADVSSNIAPILNTGLDICKNYPSNYSYNLTNMTLQSCMGEYSKPFIDNIKNSSELLIIGYGLGILSVLVWIVGRYKLEYEKFWFDKWVVVAFMIIIILICASVIRTAN